jgi:hypothetical protein
MFETLVSIREWFKMIAKRRVKKAEQSNESLHAEEKDSTTSKLGEYLNRRNREEVRYWEIQHRVENTTEKNTL